MDYHGLNPCHYFTSPGLSWDSMLTMTRTKLEFFSDIHMHLFIENGMSGGISYIAKRHSKANNKYIECYDSSKEGKYITYLDAKNLYGRTMCQYLPYNGFKWLNQKEIDRFDVSSIEENSSIGYILEFDLKYPNELHELHNGCPLAPEKLEISPKYVVKILFQYCK